MERSSPSSYRVAMKHVVAGRLVVILPTKDEEGDPAVKVIPMAISVDYPYHLDPSPLVRVGFLTQIARICAGDVYTT